MKEAPLNPPAPYRKTDNLEYSYPILEKVFQNYNQKPHKVEDIFLVGCQHFLEPQMKMIEYLIKFGFAPKNIIMLGKAYSTNDEILKELNEMGIQALQPEFSGNEFDKEHKENCQNVLKMIPAGVPVILLDDGAEMIKVFADNGREVLFAVEQTSSGFRKLSGEVLPFRVFNVARSATKLVQESPLVARHFCERLNKIYTGDKKVLIVGLGPIGSSIAKVLETGGWVVEGFDIEHGHTDLMAKINELKPPVIIGATGVQILKEEDIHKLADVGPILLVSASSSDREFPVANFRSGEKVHDDVVYKNITFADNGFPLTFMGDRNEMTPEEMEKTMCLLGGSVMYGVINKTSGTGLINVPKELEDLINQSL